MCWSLMTVRGKKAQKVFGPAVYPSDKCRVCGESVTNPSQSFEEWLNKELK